MLKFRNLDVDPFWPVTQWGVEGILTALERGSAHDWGRILIALDEDTTGVLHREVEQAVGCADQSLAILALFRNQPPAG